MAKPKKITEKVMLAAVKACADEYCRIVAKSPRGVPDCLVRFQGYTFFVEVKAPGDRLSATQKKFIKTFSNTVCIGTLGGKVTANGDILAAAEERVKSFAREIKSHLAKRGYLPIP